ncbi:MAG: dethiobiotin synthase [Proteobacteria bacterium]|nr:dethiobiotin synthase [Pseudomonadota bacterium]
MTGIFITATGTDIGKTYLTSQLLRFDRQHDRCLLASKPVISGWPENEKDIQHTDTGILLQAQELPINKESIAQCSPWRYRLALTPSMASVQSTPLEETALMGYCEELLNYAKRQNKVQLIEGVGGVMSPLTQQWTNLDWIKALKIPCILVTGSYLGALSHTLTAMVALQSKAIPVLAVVVSETKESTVGLNETVKTLTEFLPTIPVLPLAYICSSDVAMVYSCALKVTRKALSCDLA